MKTIRYYYWLIGEFAKKNIRLIILSFLVSFIGIIGLISASPYINEFLPTRKEIIGYIGKYDMSNLPEEITSRITNGLVYLNEKGEIIPTLASSWEIVNQGKEYRFHLKNQLLWSDGKKFSAYDVSYQFKDVNKKIIDDKTIYFILKKPTPIFPTYLRAPILKYPLLGVAGLYKVSSFHMTYGTFNEIVLEPNKKDLKTIIYKFYNNETQLINAYKLGEINRMVITKKTVADTFKTWKNTVVSKSVDYSRLLTVFFNNDREPLKDKEVRQAINESVDREQFKEYGELAAGPIPPTSWAYNPDIKNPLYDFEQSKKLLKKIGVASESATLSVATYYDYLPTADILDAQFKKVGIRTDLEIISYEKPSDFELLLAYWKVPSDPDQYYFWHSTQTIGNIGNYKNVKIDKFLEDGRSTIDVKERKKIYYDYQKNIIDDPPAIFLYYPYVYTIRRK